MNTFTASSCLTFGWETFKTRALFLAGVTLLFLVVLGIVRSVGHGVILTIISYGLSILVDMGIVAFSLKAHDSLATVTIHDLWHPQSYINYVLATIMVGVLVVLGLILLIVPGVILMLMWMFVKQLIIERGLKPLEALKESARITKGNRMQLFLLLLAIIVMNIVGALALVVGLLVTVPITLLSITHAYRVLAAKAGPVASIA
jgi:uncharacterized membrane protein